MLINPNLLVGNVGESSLLERSPAGKQPLNRESQGVNMSHQCLALRTLFFNVRK